MHHTGAASRTPCNVVPSRVRAPKGCLRNMETRQQHSAFTTALAFLLWRLSLSVFIKEGPFPFLPCPAPPCHGLAESTQSRLLPTSVAMATTLRERSCCACCSPRALIYGWWAVNTVRTFYCVVRPLRVALLLCKPLYVHGFLTHLCVLQAISASFAALAIVNSRHISVSYVGLLWFRNVGLHVTHCSRSADMVWYRYTTLTSKMPTLAKLASLLLVSWGQLWFWPSLS